jgi:mRNA interferase RelE/StbE
MKYAVEIEQRALKSLAKIPTNDRRRVIVAIDKLAVSPRPIGAKKLTGREAWRIRIGNYRILYEIHDRICYVLVVDVGHRKEIYR